VRRDVLRFSVEARQRRPPLALGALSHQPGYEAVAFGEAFDFDPQNVKRLRDLLQLRRADLGSDKSSGECDAARRAEEHDVVVAERTENHVL